MIGFNHGLSGGLIARFVPLPLALPLALASHFVMDMLPHYGIPHEQRDKSVFWKVFFTFDALATLGLAIFAIYDNHFYMFLGGLFATMPDYIWVGRVIKSRSFNLGNNKSWFTKWHVSIQGLERPWGLIIELPLAAVLFYVTFFIVW